MKDFNAAKIHALLATLATLAITSTPALADEGERCFDKAGRHALSVLRKVEQFENYQRSYPPATRFDLCAGQYGESSVEVRGAHLPTPDGRAYRWYEIQSYPEFGYAYFRTQTGVTLGLEDGFAIAAGFEVQFSQLCVEERFGSHWVAHVNDVPYDYGQAYPANPNIEVGPPNDDGISDGLLLIESECSNFPE